MRKSVLFIAKFDNILKSMNTILSSSFNMQMCPPEPTMVQKTLNVMEVDLVLLYISGLPEIILNEMCAKLDDVYMQTPIVVFGTVDECRDFDSYSSIVISKYLYRPIAAHDISKAISELLDNRPTAPQPLPEVDANASFTNTQVENSALFADIKAQRSRKLADIQAKMGANFGDVQPKRGMSLADLADSLESDNRRCILLVDDDGRILRAIKMLLEKKYRINIANSGMSALESIERERPDAVLLDYEMPVLNGKQTLEIIRQNQKTKDLPVFFLTGVADSERIKDVIHLKPQGYLLKSSDQGAILDMLDKFFSGTK